MTERNPGRVRRALATLLYRLIVIALTLGILLAGYRLATALLRQVDEQTRAASRAPLYAQTVTAIAPTLITHTPQPSATPTETSTPAPTDTPVPATAGAQSLPVFFSIPPRAGGLAEGAVAQDFVTNTPRPASPADVTLPAVNTAAPPATEAAPAATLGGQVPTARPLPTLFVFGAAPSDASAATAIPTPVEYVDRRGQNLMNILLMGNDGEITDDGFIRTDTMIIVSINRDAGTVSMLSLPRDLYVYIPGWTMQRLNLAYIHGEAVGWTDGGFGLMRQTILYNFGINVHYYAMVNLTGMRSIIDTIGGVELAVDCAIEDLPLIGADVPAAALPPDEVGYRILPVGYYQMTGGEALWYARSRHNSIEFDRGRRQMQVLRAIWRKARDTGLLQNLPTLWSEGIQYTETNLTLEDILGLLPLAATLDPSRIESFHFLRLYHTTPWTTPDGENVQLPVYDTIRPMLEDFYSPPTENQVRVEGARIRVQNGTTNADWDRVASERLGYSGFLAVAGGSAAATDYADTVLIDYTGSDKGSSLQEIARILNVRPENIRIEPNPNREVDFEVILGANYNSCTEAAVTEVGE